MSNDTLLLNDSSANWNDTSISIEQILNHDNSSVILFQVTVALAVAFGNYRSRDHDHCLDIG